MSPDERIAKSELKRDEPLQEPADTVRDGTGGEIRPETPCPAPATELVRWDLVNAPQLEPVIRARHAEPIARAAQAPPVSYESRAEPATDTSQADGIKAAEVVAFLTDNGMRVDRGPIFPMGVISVPLLVLTLIACLQSGEGISAGVCIVALVAIGTIMRQAELLELERAALRHTHLDKISLGALSEALEWPDGRVKAIARRLLTEFLPRLRAGDDNLFNRQRRNCLYRRLTPRTARFHSELTIAILRALPHIGTDGAVPYVARLAARRAFTRAGQRVRDAARATMPLLEDRVADLRRAADARKAAEAARQSAGGVIGTDSELEAARAVATQVDARMRAFEQELREVQAPGMRLGFLLASWGIIVPYTAFQAYSQFALGHWPLGALLAVLALLSTQLHRLTLNDRHKLLARRLGEMDDVRCIGRLAELLEWPDENARAVATIALMRLLPRVKASDRVQLTPAQRGCLHRMLAPAQAARHAEFLIQLLKALEQIGDAAAIPYVEHLAGAQLASAQGRSVCDAASDCLPYLMERSELNRSSQSLLRASSAASAGTDTLVRASSGASATNEEELLRASVGDSSGD